MKVLRGLFVGSFNLGSFVLMVWKDLGQGSGFSYSLSVNPGSVVDDVKYSFSSPQNQINFTSPKLLFCYS